MRYAFWLILEILKWQFSHWKEKVRQKSYSTEPHLKPDAKRLLEELASKRSLRSVAEDIPKNDDYLVLVDGTFYNFVYWFKVLSFLNVKSFLNAKVNVFRGYYNRNLVADICKICNFQISSLTPIRINLGVFIETASYFKILNEPKDILKNNFCGIPGKFVYDELLRAQKKASVELNSKAFFSLYVICLYYHYSVNIFNSHQPDTILLSHIHTTHGLAMCSKAFSLRKTVIFMSSAFGSFRFTKLRCFEDFLKISNAISPNELKAFSQKARASLSKAGSVYLTKRFGGQLDDVGSRFAYGDLSSETINPTRKYICQKFNWDPEVPILSIYASKWFDTPHAYGMKNFIDFHDWITATLDRINQINNAHWLLKPHPCDRWYGGVTLRDIFIEQDLGKVRYVDDNWSSESIIKNTDGVVTVHGTCGLEYAYFGKPVLCADHGWYDNFGFVQAVTSRSEYLYKLDHFWHKKPSHLDIAQLKQFVGHFYARPKIDQNYWLPDDFKQDDVISDIKKMYYQKNHNWINDIQLLDDWFCSKEECYKKFKMRGSDEYIS